MCLSHILASTEKTASMLLNFLNLLKQGSHTQQIYEKCLVLSLNTAKELFGRKLLDMSEKHARNCFNNLTV